jgi:hypothetical protein
MDSPKECQAFKKLKTNHNFQDILPQHRSPRAGWNSLPAELRLEIYYYLIPRCEQSINVSSPKFENRFFREYNDPVGNIENNDEDDLPWTKILLINKQISHECLDILYGQNSFQIEMHKTGEADLRQNFTRENRLRMRYITVAFLGTEGANFPPGNLIPDYDLWVDVLPTVKELWLILLQPYKPPTLDKVYPGDEEWVGRLWDRFEQYLEWLPPYLECFYDLLPHSTGVNIMSDNGLETKGIAMKYLSSKYRAFIDNTVPSPFGSTDDGDDGPTSS